MAWFDDLKTPRIKTQVSQRTSKVPEGLWVKCTHCGEILQSKILKDNLSGLPGMLLSLSHDGAAERIAMLTDDGSFDEYAEDLVSTDPLEFDDTKPYKERLRSAAGSTGLRDAFVVGQGQAGWVCRITWAFLNSSSWAAAWASSWARRSPAFSKRRFEDKLPAVVVSASGGARMQEGILSLMQMAKTTGAARTSCARRGFPIFRF